MRRTRARSASGIGAEPETERPSRRVQGIRGRRAIRSRCQRIREEAGGDVVAALGQRDGHLAVGPLVELRRTAGARPGSAGEASIAGLEETGGHETIEVKGCEGPRDPDGGSSGIPADGFVLRDDVPVQLTPNGIAEQGDAVDRLVEGGIHPTSVAAVASSTSRRMF